MVFPICKNKSSSYGLFVVMFLGRVWVQNRSRTHPRPPLPRRCPEAPRTLPEGLHISSGERPGAKNGGKTIGGTPLFPREGSGTRVLEASLLKSGLPLMVFPPFLAPGGSPDAPRTKYDAPRTVPGRSCVRTFLRTGGRSGVGVE